MKHLTITVLLVCTVTFSQGVEEEVTAIFDRVQKEGSKEVYKAIQELRDLGAAAVDPIKTNLTRTDPNCKIVAAAVLYKSGQRKESLETLLAVASDNSNAEPQLVACKELDVLSEGDNSLQGNERRDFSARIQKIAASSKSEIVQIYLWKSIWNYTSAPMPKRNIRKIFLETENDEVKDLAAITLARTGEFLTVQQHLKKISERQDDTGVLARTLLKVHEMNEQIQRLLSSESQQNDNDYDFKLLAEVIELLKENFHDPEKIDMKKMIRNAARGIAGSFDPYTSYFDENEYRTLKDEELEGHYGGIGARVSMRRDKAGNSWLTITEPIFSGPAYRAGLRSNDRIVEIEGEPSVNKDLQELVKKLRGKPGTSVKIKVYRAGWEKPKDFEIKREEIQLENVQKVLLPGKIGYIKLTTFGSEEHVKMKKAIEALETEGASGLILDLRGNGGGYLPTSVAIADLFLPPGKTVVSVKRGTEEVSRELTKTPYECKLPLVILVDGGSASASEILAGALRDHGRATIIGEKTFGKGSVQRTRELKSMNYKEAVKITIGRWYLPSGKSVEADDPKNSGIMPDIVVTPPARDLWVENEIEKVRASEVVDKYMQEYFKMHKDVFRRLAETDQKSFAEYPDFDKLYDSAKTRLSKDEFRVIVRDYARRWVQDDMGKEIPVDLQEDIQLQSAIRKIAQETGLSLKTVKEYGFMEENK